MYLRGRSLIGCQLVPIYVHGASAQAYLDLGSEESYISGSFADALGATQNPAKNRRTYYDLTNKKHTAKYRIKASVSMNGLEIKDQYLYVLPGDLWPWVFVGSEILRRLRRMNSDRQSSGESRNTQFYPQAFQSTSLPVRTATNLPPPSTYYVSQQRYIPASTNQAGYQIGTPQTQAGSSTSEDHNFSQSNYPSQTEYYPPTSYPNISQPGAARPNAENRDILIVTPRRAPKVQRQTKHMIRLLITWRHQEAILDFQTRRRNMDA
jgi:hypothetical protein